MVVWNSWSKMFLVERAEELLVIVSGASSRPSRVTAAVNAQCLRRRSILALHSPKAPPMRGKMPPCQKVERAVDNGPGVLGVVLLENSVS